MASAKDDEPEWVRAYMRKALQRFFLAVGIGAAIMVVGGKLVCGDAGSVPPSRACSSPDSRIVDAPNVSTRPSVEGGLVEGASGPQGSVNGSPMTLITQPGPFVVGSEEAETAYENQSHRPWSFGFGT